MANRYVITVIAVLTSDNELTQTQHKNSKFSGIESNNDINNTVISGTSGNANVKSLKNCDVISDVIQKRAY